MRFTLLSRLLLYILAPSIIGLAVVSGISNYTAEQALNAQIHEEMSLAVDLQQKQLDAITAQLFDAIDNSAHTPQLMDLLEAYTDPNAAGDRASLREAAQKALKNMVASYNLIQNAGLIAADGTVLAHGTESSIGTSRAQRAYFKASIQGRKSAENIISATSHKLTTIISTPVRINGKVAGVLFADIDTSHLGSQTIEAVKIGTTGICYIYSDTGIMLMHPNKKYIGDNDSSEAWTQKILQERNGNIIYTWDNRHKLAYFKEVKNMNWILVLAVDQEDILLPISKMVRNNILLVIVSISVVGLIIFLAARSISSTLHIAAGYVSYVGEGNLNISSEMQRSLEGVGQRRDEIGTLACGIERMVASIRTLFAEAEQKTKEAETATRKAQEAMREAEEARKAAENAKREGMLAAAAQLEDVVSVISSASDQLSARIGASECGAAEQAARASETATAMEEMNTTVIEVAKNAGDAAALSAQTREKAQQGEEIVLAVMETINDVQQQSMKLKEDMRALDDHAQAIGQIMGVISDIADQTNLLALNAAIEAARAGEAGRGFAVVADEVRKLAEKTMASTTQVSAVIAAIQNSASQSMKQVETAAYTIDGVTAQAGRSSDMLREILGMTENTADQVQTIAAASEEQSAASEEISKAVTQVNAIAGETAGAMQEASRAVNELAHQAHVLTGLIEEMRNA